MSKSPSLRRIQADVRELKFNPSHRYYAAPLEDDMFEWHFTIRGPSDSEFEGGVYHGKILLPSEYPFKPPNIVFLTPSGRFEVNTKVCLSFTAHHAELWQPAWGIRLILEALISFFPTPADGAIGALNWTAEERKRLAKKSMEFCCPRCGPILSQLPKMEDINQDNITCSFTDEIAKLHMLQQMHHHNEKGDEVGENHKESCLQSGIRKNYVDESNITIANSENTACGEQKDEQDTNVTTSQDSIDQVNDQLCEGNDEIIEESEKFQEKQVRDEIMKLSVEDDPDQTVGLNVQILDNTESVVENYIPTWLTDPVLDVMLLFSVIVVILLVRKVQELTAELNSL